ncbi:hypothetical protein AAFF_G00337820 [Aldrovandia affinis]|uniref:Uncharacterized protein n=1 Tax=Aldrovandia affinis TaxID=143900 RepID=A0AAD7SLA6_9TELE|nr:hypothetical protein AAFF_G00337820 [Aldrovandia affinis]
MDELRSLVAKDNDFHSTSVFAFVETHLSPLVPDETVELEGFSMFRADRDFELEDLHNNDKPWFTAQLRRLRSEKEEARRSGDKDRFKEAKYRFAKRRRSGEHRFSEKLQQQFSEGIPPPSGKASKP